MSTMSPSGNRYGRYILGRQLGIGGMAVVHKAFDPERQIHVALKTLHSHFADDARVVYRFRREAEIARQLQHPNIVAIYDFGEIGNKPYLTMKYMLRGSLADRFQCPTPVMLRTSAGLLQKIAGALDYAHQNDVIHRDIKLENILLDEDNNPMLSDFGIARALYSTQITVTWVPIGTPQCMSPEQIWGKTRDLDYRTDLYSLAIMAYLMATGYYPFTATPQAELYVQIRDQTPPLPSQVNPNLPKALDQVLLKGLAKSREDRYQSAEAFAKDFEQAIVRHGRQTTIIRLPDPNPVEPTTVIGGRTLPSRPQRRRPVISVIIGIVFVIIVLLALWLLGGFGGRNTATPTSDSTAVANQIYARLTETAQSWTNTPTATRSPTPTRTQTPAPTDTPSQTPTLTLTSTLTDLPGIYTKVTRSPGIDLINGPGNEYGRGAFLQTHMRLLMIGRTDDARWIQVVTPDGKVGWVAIDWVDAVQDVVNTLPVVWTNLSSVTLVPTSALPTFTLSAPFVTIIPGSPSISTVTAATLIPVSIPTLTLPPATAAATLIEQLSVNSAQNTPTFSTNSLQSGVTYRIEVSGTYYDGSSMFADAECATGDAAWATASDQGPHLELLVVYGSTIGTPHLNSAQSITAQDVNWGSCTATHLYSLTVVGNGGNIGFVVSDEFWGDPGLYCGSSFCQNNGTFDNTGSLTVKIIR